MSRLTTTLLVVLALSTVARTGVAQSEPRKFAVVVGANDAAPGRKPLRFSYDDARAVALVLTELGGFAANDVSLLLDPDPSLVLNELDRRLAAAQRAGGESMLVFYYSGHADGAALYPRGRVLPLTGVRERLSDVRAGVRLGVIDACRGGGWTGAKGLSEAEPFEVNLPLTLHNEGSILISSSSGLEDAHESEQLGGSFFTHYWNAGLRGAADRNGDSQVGIHEAFEYAKLLTIRDTALLTSAPQHPSFAMQLRGRHDLALSSLSSAGTTLSVAQEQGPLELVHLESGVVILELPKGPRRVQLAVAPGRYLIRRRTQGAVWSRELALAAGTTTTLGERELQPSAGGNPVGKRANVRPLTLTTLPAHAQEITAAVGILHTGSYSGVAMSGSDRAFVAGANAPRGLTDRLQWIIPTLGFAYRAGTQGGLEWIPWGGIPSWNVMLSSVNDAVWFMARPGLGLDVRRWLGARSSLEAGVGLSSLMSIYTGRRWRPVGDSERVVDGQAPTSWRAKLSIGYTHTLADTVTFHIAFALEENLLLRGDLPDFSPRSRESALTLSFGSVQQIGLRRNPLLRVHLSDHFAFNLDAAVSHDFSRRRTRETYLVGASWFW